MASATLVNYVNTNKVHAIVISIDGLPSLIVY